MCQECLPTPRGLGARGCNNTDFIAILHHRAAAAALRPSIRLLFFFERAPQSRAEKTVIISSTSCICQRGLIFRDRRPSSPGRRAASALANGGLLAYSRCRWGGSRNPLATSNQPLRAFAVQDVVSLHPHQPLRRGRAVDVGRDELLNFPSLQPHIPPQPGDVLIQQAPDSGPSAPST